MTPARKNRADRPGWGEAPQNIGHKRTSSGLIVRARTPGPAPGQPHRYCVQRPPPSSRALVSSLLATTNRDSWLFAHGTRREGSWPRKKRNSRVVSASVWAAVSLRAALLAIAIASRMARRKVALH